jgi:hypothetical protein
MTLDETIRKNAELGCTLAELQVDLNRATRAKAEARDKLNIALHAYERGDVQFQTTEMVARQFIADGRAEAAARAAANGSGASWPCDAAREKKPRGQTMHHAQKF